MKVCVYGGQYGSEGKGSLAEWFANQSRIGDRLVVAGDNSPNSGHTCSRGKTRNIPAASYWADVILLGPDAVIDLATLREDLEAVRKSRTAEPFAVIIHENAALMRDSHPADEALVVERISSTGSGSGAARYDKQFRRSSYATIGSNIGCVADVQREFPGLEVQICNHWQYQHHVQDLSEDDWIFEGSQGTLLDVNWGRYPWVTSRSTLPRVSIERNGLGQFDWEYYGVFRTYPIRTGGPSGPTGGDEITFESIGMKPEIATVTKRTRRIFKFSIDDYLLSIRLNRPDGIAFTHLDYVGLRGAEHREFIQWFKDQGGSLAMLAARQILLSHELGQFSEVV